jgi:sulfate adenylyltransferase
MSFTSSVLWLGLGQTVELTHNGTTVATLNVDDIFQYDKKDEARRVFKTEDEKHPGVAALYAQDDFYVGGKVVSVSLPRHDEFAPNNLTPNESRAEFKRRGWKTVVGFQTRNPIHRAHEAITKTALEDVDGLFLHPLVGETKPGDVPAAARMASYRVLVENHYEPGRVVLSVYPGNMHYAGPREALMHALVRKNYGCTHFIVGRDHAGVGSYYGPNEAKEFLQGFDVAELGITPMYFEKALNVSGSEIRKYLDQGKCPPADMMRPDVAQILLDALKK